MTKIGQKLWNTQEGQFLPNFAAAAKANSKNQVWVRGFFNVQYLFSG